MIFYRLENTDILIHRRRSYTASRALLPPANWSSSRTGRWSIISEDIEGEPLATLVVNKLRGGLKVAAVKAPVSAILPASSRSRISRS